MITITYFGALKLLQPSGREELAWHGGTTDDLLTQLRARGPAWSEALRPGRIYRLAVNQQLLQGPAALHEGDDVAILPPVTGG
jgi:molybdopterin synthase sulfur carrier subunit